MEPLLELLGTEKQILADAIFAKILLVSPWIERAIEYRNTKFEACLT